MFVLTKSYCILILPTIIDLRRLVLDCWHKLNGFTRGLFSAILSYFCNVFRLLAFLSLCFLFLFFMLRLGISSSQWTFAALALLSFYLSLAEYSKLCPCFYSYLMRVLRATFQVHICVTQQFHASCPVSHFPRLYELLRAVRSVLRVYLYPVLRLIMRYSENIHAIDNN